MANRSAGLQALNEELEALHELVKALKIPLKGEKDDNSFLPAALAELQAAVQELHERWGELTTYGELLSQQEAGERELLGRLFQNLPVPLFLLDHEGVIRRVNNAAADGFGFPQACLTGRPFMTLLDGAERDVFLSELTTLLHAGKPRSVGLRMTGSDAHGHARLRMTRINVSHEAHPLVVVIAHRLPSAQRARQPERVRPEETVRWLDLIAKVTRPLVSDEHLSERGLLEGVARQLAADFADWVIVDVVRDRRWQRAVVHGPSDQVGVAGTGVLAALDPRQGRIPKRLVEKGAAIIESHLEGDELGHAGDGTPAVAVLRAGSLLSAPMKYDDTTMGAITVVRRDNRPWFTFTDLAVLEVVCDHVGAAVRRTRGRGRRRSAERLLQVGQTPQTLPMIPGVELASAYACASLGSSTTRSEVGGDFYDVFESSGGWGFVLGDVAGKGEEAAVLTALVWHGARILSRWNDRPDDVLCRIHTAMQGQHDADRFVTAIAGHLTWEEGRAKVTLASAGHPPAAILRGDGSVPFASGGGLPLGVSADPCTEPDELVLMPGDTLVLYTDGVTEARSRDGRYFGDDGLTESLSHGVGLSASALVKSLERDLDEFSDGRFRDDLAVLAIRIPHDPIADQWQRQ